MSMLLTSLLKGRTLDAVNAECAQNLKRQSQQKPRMAHVHTQSGLTYSRLYPASTLMRA